MYQSVYFDYKEQQYYLRDDVENWIIFKHQPTYFKRVKLKQNNALPVLTGGWAIPTKRFDKEDPNLLEKDINKELVILRDLYHDEGDNIPKWHNIVYLDIETEMGGAITPQYLQDAPVPVTAIALIDSTTKQKICFILDKSGEITETTEKEKHIIPCKTEKELFLKFLDKWEELDATIVATWNGEYFDIPYLYYRMCKIIGMTEVLRLSPIKKINIIDYNPNEILIRIGGINHLDYMILFKKYEQKQEPSYKLKDIGPKYAGLEKIEFEGNLNQLFKANKEIFIEYNLRDVEILDALEEKLKYINLTIMMCHICSIPYEQVYYNTVLNEGAILKYLKKNGIVAPNKPTTQNISRKIKEETYAGGYIKTPNPGLYFDCIDLDFTSLYPSIIKSLNLGIETLVGRIKVNSTYEQNYSLEKLKERDEKEIITIERLDKINYTLNSAEINIGDLIKIIEEQKYTISASGALFRTDVRSVCAQILEEWFEKREDYRDKKKKAGKAKEWEKYKSYDTFQYAFKILQNAMYGTYAKNGWRFTDGFLICSCAITNSGQRLTQESIKFVNNKLNKEIKQEKDHILISDTDSLYIELGDILKHRYKNLDNKDQKILEIAHEIQDDSNKYLNELSKNLFNVNGKHFFTLKQEIIASSILVTGKRRYGMFITNKEGVSIPPDSEDALDLKGLEVMKSNMNRLFKSFGENFIKNILFGKPKEELDTSILTFYKSLSTIDPKKLGKPIGISFITKCIKRPPTLGEIFSELNINTKEHSKAAIYYNDLLKFKKWDKKYESIIEGDKIYVINLKPNPYNIDAIAIPNNTIPPDIDEFIKEYIDIEQIFESSILKKLRELYKDLKWDFPSLNPKVHRFFKFV